MEIKLKSNRNFMFKIIIPFIIILSICVLGLLVTMIIFHEITIDTVIALCIVSFVDALYLIALFIAIFKSKPTFVFNNKEIMYRKGENINIIKLEDIKSLTYYSIKWYHFIVPYRTGKSAYLKNKITPLTILLEEKTGEKHQLGYFTKKEAFSLKAIYGELLEIVE